MTTAPTDSILVVDIGNITTRAALFDIVSGDFRFVAGGEARSTAEPPYANVEEGLHHALEELQKVTGRAFVDANDRVIIPTAPDGNGVDSFAATASVGDPLRVAVVGLMPNISLSSAHRLAASTYALVGEALGLGDRRREAQQLDALLAAKPEVVIIAGGTENGSQSAVLRLAETVALASRRMPEGTRPEILFAGNGAMQDKIKAMFEGLSEVFVADNLRPELDNEIIAPARRQLAWLYEHIRLASFGGYTDLSQWGTGSVTPTATAFGNVIRFMSETSGNKSTLGVDVGSMSTVMAAATGDDLVLTVRPDVGVGHSALRLLSQAKLDHISRWLPEDFSDDEVRDYVYNKSLAPATVPHELREIYLEHALARQCLQATFATARPAWAGKVKATYGGLMPAFETIIGSGAVLGRAPRFGQAALMMVDGLQPTGVVTLMLDMHNLLPAVGAAAMQNPIAAAQVLQSQSFASLGVVVSLVGEARLGQNVVRVKLNPTQGEAVDMKVPYGSLEVLRLPPGQEAKLTVQPLRGFDAGFGAGVSKTMTITGGEVGVIIDARGRPIEFPATPEKQRDAVSRWCARLGEYGI
ncbi:MAG: glutamate mutase L [Chloroflexi bacterium]|nr:glutamate mutase L [Chloroflexota bacterium]